MRSLSFLVITLAVLQLASAAPWNWLSKLFQSSSEKVSKPEFCGEHECPEYTVLQAFNGYELREYSPSVWASTPIPKMDGDYWENTEYMKGSFWKLFYYIQGVNDQNQTMDMTVPVVNSHAKNEVWMNFMIPSNHSANPPKPDDKTVEIYRAKTDQYYVRSFSGWATSIYGYNRFPAEFERLKRDLERDGQSYTVDPMFFTAQYNDPWQIFGRHNEVWIMKK